ncbi:MAG: ABC transporter ATP-binding protein [Defluviimonas sp.]|uniref:ABC transporter ATP-binding protein n=1 Tax=Albidovulum sp. TaxID=1872424 RepID=UPI001D2DBBEA|nr:ABC transporter ATP-binding protein [Paracoccaceae bacterium]MCC0064532.1 ABC transporter ATP-binding protein [Defluviimonas sp.]
MAGATLVMVIEGSTLAALSWLLKPLFDKVFVPGSGGSMAFVGGAIFGLFLVRAATSLIYKTMLTRISLKTSTAMQIDLLRHLLTLDGAFFQTNPPGSLIERVQGDTNAVQALWSTIISGMGRDVVSLISLFGVALAINPLWTAAVLVGAPALILPTVLVQRYVRRKAIFVRRQNARRATRLDEIFHGITAIKLNQMEEFQLARFVEIIRSIVRAQVKTAMSRAALPSLIDVVTGIGFLGVLLLAGPQIAAGHKTVGDFMSFFSATILAFQPLRRLGAMAGTWHVAAASLTRVYTLFDTRSEILPPRQPVAPDPERTEIRFDNVHLSYGDHPVLRGLSFTARAGSTTAIVGPSGAGKSTVFNLLTRMIDPQSGQITIGARSVTDFTLPALRELFSVVTQDATLFDETIRDNILVGHSGIGNERLRAAMDAAHVSEFVDALPRRLETPAGPRGSGLSGGQRQRIAIARAVLRDTPILLLDEATSALDAASEALVQQALERLSRGRTTLVVAHRLATVRDADHIIVMDSGRVVEEGTHESLLKNDGLYASLCRLQFSD